MTHTLCWRRASTRPSTIEQLDAAVRAAEPDGKGLPVLVRHYLKLGGRILCANLDPAFSNALDGHKEFKRRELEHELGHENKPRENKGMWFYNVPKGKELEAKSYGLRQTKSGKWYSRRPNAVSDKEFGQGRYWEPK